ncbi:MAG TPA: hypothetical protein VME43_31145 [Bryobacteraceae bacterium]|nr:hypothetical protein [Bryobacteraceae bacterium]
MSILFALILALPLGAQSLVCRDGRCERTIYGTGPATTRLRIRAHGPVTLEGGASNNLSYVVSVKVNARTEAEGRRTLQQFAVRTESLGGWTVISMPGGAALTTVTVKTPKLLGASIFTSDGAVDVSGVDGPVEVESGAGPLRADRIHGDCRLMTGGGNIQIGQVGGALRCTTGAGQITVRSVRGEAVLETQGGDITVTDAAGEVRADTGGGGVHIVRAGGLVSATSGGGEIVVDRAGGIVTARNMAGPVEVGAAAGVRCESASGGVRLRNISGSMNVSTSLGSIIAILLGSRLGNSYLATANGDITVLIPSNVGVNIQAQNKMADTLRRIVSDFPGIQARRQGNLVVAEGAVNGGGALLQISGTGGTIFIKKQ